MRSEAKYLRLHRSAGTSTRLVVHKPMAANRSASTCWVDTIYWDVLEATKGGKEKHETVTATGYLEEYITVVLNLRVKNGHCHGKWP